MTSEFQIQYPDASFHFFDQLVAQSASFYYVKTADAATLGRRLASYQEFTGQVTYQWLADSGLRRFDIPHIVLPRTTNLLSALRHIRKSIHFGIYLITDFNEALRQPMAVNEIQAYLDSYHAARKILIFADPDPKIPPEMLPHFKEIRHSPLFDRSNPVLQPIIDYI